MIYNTIECISNKIKNSEMYCRLEKRPEKYMFGTNNYGEIIDTINPSDGDPWDIIVPGYNSLDTDTLYTIKQLEGVIVMPNGNHKLIVNIHINSYRQSFKERKNEIFNYRRLYNRLCKKRGDVIFF